MLISQNQLERLIRSMINESSGPTDRDKKEFQKRLKELGLEDGYGKKARPIEERDRKFIKKYIGSDATSYINKEREGYRYFITVGFYDSRGGSWLARRGKEIKNIIAYYNSAFRSVNNKDIPRVDLLEKYFERVVFEKRPRTYQASLAIYEVNEKKLIDETFSGFTIPPELGGQPKEKAKKSRKSSRDNLSFDQRVTNLLNEFGLKDKNEVKKIDSNIVAKLSKVNFYKNYLGAYYEKDDPDNTFFIAFGDSEESSDLDFDDLLFEAKNDAIPKVLGMYQDAFMKRHSLSSVNYKDNSESATKYGESLKNDIYSPIDTPFSGKGAGVIYEQSRYAAIFLVVVNHTLVEKILIDLNSKGGKGEKQPGEEKVVPEKDVAIPSTVDKTQEAGDEEVEVELDYTDIDLEDLSDDDEKKVKDLRKQLKDLGIEF